MGVLWGTVFFVMVAMSAPAFAAEPYKLGYVTDLSGPIRDSFAPVVEAFKLYMKAVNDRGGINGHPVELFVRNDQLDAVRAASLCTELITAENVNSIWGMSVSVTHKAVYETAKRHKVPAVACFSGGKDSLPPEATPYAYSLGHVFEIGGEASGKFAAELLQGKGKMVVNSIEAPGGYAACNYAEQAAKAGGLTTGQILFPTNTTEFGAVTQKVVEMKPDIVNIHNPFGSGMAMLRALRGLGYKGAIMEAALGFDEFAYGEVIESTGYTDNTYLLSRWAPGDAEGPQMDALRAAAKKYGLAGKVCIGHVSGWALGLLAETALKQCGWPCSGEKLNQLLENITVDTGGLMGGPIKFSPKDHYGTTWWRVFKYDGASKSFKAVTGWKENSSTPMQKP
jgi:branched-chain amino acid transport system substrate-binding protein